MARDGAGGQSRASLRKGKKGGHADASQLRRLPAVSCSHTAARWTPKTVPDQLPTSTSRGQGVSTSSSQKKLHPRAGETSTGSQGYVGKGVGMAM